MVVKEVDITVSKPPKSIWLAILIYFKISFIVRKLIKQKRSPNILVYDLHRKKHWMFVKCSWSSLGVTTDL